MSTSSRGARPGRARTVPGIAQARQGQVSAPAQYHSKAERRALAQLAQKVAASSALPNQSSWHARPAATARSTTAFRTEERGHQNTYFTPSSGASTMPLVTQVSPTIMLLHISMDMKSKPTPLSTQAPPPSSSGAPKQEAVPRTHGSVPAIAYAVQLASVVGTLHPLTLLLPAATQLPHTRGHIVFVGGVLTPKEY